MSPERTFQTLVAIGLVTGGWLYGDYWKKHGLVDGPDSEISGLKAENRELTLKLDELEGEVANVRSKLAKGPYTIPEELISFVEKDMGMVFREAPKARSASPAVLRNAAEAKLKLTRGDQGLNLENMAWELLGLIPRDQSLLGQWIAVETVGSLGLFDFTTGEILLSEKFNDQSAPELAILVRLLAMQLAFQNHPKSEWQTRDEWQAWEATFLGAAASTQARYMRSRSAVEETSEWKDPESEKERLLFQLSPALQGFVNFAYLEGNAYATSHYIKTRAAYLEMFRQPPTTTASVIHAEEARRSATAISFLKTAGTILGEDSLGELGLRIWVEPFIGTDPANSLASKWRGDRYQLRDHEKTLTLTWYVELATEEDAQLLEREVRRSMLAPMHELQTNREIKISTSGTRFTLINTPKKP